MSCFVVTDYHVNALITWAELHSVPLPYAAPVAAELLAGNHRRLRHRRLRGGGNS